MFCTIPTGRHFYNCVCYAKNFIVFLDLVELCFIYFFVRACVICLAPSHPLFSQPNMEIMEIDFDIGKVDRRDNITFGKRKNEF